MKHISSQVKETVAINLSKWTVRHCFTEGYGNGTLEATVRDIDAWDRRRHVVIDGDDPNAESVRSRHWFSPKLRKCNCSGTHVGARVVN